MKLAWPPAVNHFEQLSEFQHTVLTKVANREDKSFVALSGEPGTPEENDRNLLFNDVLRLIELGFFLELDRGDERYARMLNQFAQKGIHFVMMEMTNRGLWMWEQTPWEKYKN